MGGEGKWGGMDVRREGCERKGRNVREGGVDVRGREGWV